MSTMKYQSYPGPRQDENPMSPWSSACHVTDLCRLTSIVKNSRCSRDAPFPYRTKAKNTGQEQWTGTLKSKFKEKYY
jgi:hypothetical protein